MFNNVKKLFITHCVTRKQKVVENQEDFKEKIQIMADKKLHKSYAKKITSLKTIDSIGFLDKVITEWEQEHSCKVLFNKKTRDTQLIHKIIYTF